MPDAVQGDRHVRVLFELERAGRHGGSDCTVGIAVLRADQVEAVDAVPEQNEAVEIVLPLLCHLAYHAGVDPKLDMIYILMEQTQNERSRITPAFKKLVYDAFDAAN